MHRVREGGSFLSELRHSQHCHHGAAAPLETGFSRWQHEPEETAVKQRQERRGRDSAENWLPPWRWLRAAGWDQPSTSRSESADLTQGSCSPRSQLPRVCEGLTCTPVSLEGVTLADEHRHLTDVHSIGHCQRRRDPVLPLPVTGLPPTPEHSSSPVERGPKRQPCLSGGPVRWWVVSERGEGSTSSHGCSGERKASFCSSRRCISGL